MGRRNQKKNKKTKKKKESEAGIWMREKKVAEFKAGRTFDLDVGSF